jgi:hypothetical protein
MVSRATLETYILEHDFCHLLGLTNDGATMVTAHESSDHKAHCENENCLMYWKADENMLLVDLLSGVNNQESGNGDLLPTLDANCIADLQAAGGK